MPKRHGRHHRKVVFPVKIVRWYDAYGVEKLFVNGNLVWSRPRVHFIGLTPSLQKVYE